MASHIIKRTAGLWLESRKEQSNDIDGNETEKHAMQEFHKGNRAEGLRIQEEFASAFRTEYADKDHCPCQKACRYHATVKNVLPFTGHIRSMYRTACVR